MLKYQYQIIRYRHDRVTGEFVNVGIIIYEPKSQLIKAKVLNKFSRVSNFFGDISGHFLINTLKQIEKEINSFKNDISFFLSQDQKIANELVILNEITTKIILQDDSALYLSEIKFGLDINMETALSDLYYRLIGSYIQEGNKEAHKDSDSWTHVYKTYFDKYGITSRLKDHIVKTQNDEIKFDKAWKNGVWNCYQPLYFDLVKRDSIKAKVYKWSGIIRELESLDEKLNINFLITSPSNDSHLQNFIKQTLNSSGKKLNVAIVTETEAEEFALNVKNAILNSDNH